MWNGWILFTCFGIIALSVVSCSYANNEIDILNNTVGINTPPVDLESNNQNNDILDDANSNISIYYGERIDLDWEYDEPKDGELGWDYNEHCNCTVYIDNKLVNFIQDFKYGRTINMYNYDSYYSEDLNSIYPNVGLHNISIIFEFNNPQKYDITINKYKNESEDRYICNVLLFRFNINDDSEAKKRYSYNATLNILKKDKTVHITNISSFATYREYPLIVFFSNVSSCYIIISNETEIILFRNYYSPDGYCYINFFVDLENKIRPGIYNFTVVNEYDNTFDSSLFNFYNDLRVNVTYNIKGNDVIFNVDAWCEFNCYLAFELFIIINETYKTYMDIIKEISIKNNNYKLNFDVCFNNIENNYYYANCYKINLIDGSYYSIGDFSFLINNTFVNETGFIEDVSDVNETDNVSDIVEKNVSNTYNGNNTDGDGTGGNGTGDNLNLKGNSTNSHSHKSNVHNDDFKEVISGFGDLASSVDPVSSEHANSYELIEKSTSKSSDNIFANLGIIILLLIALIVGFLRFKREN